MSFSEKNLHVAFYSSGLSLNSACCVAIKNIIYNHLYLLKQILPSLNIIPYHYDGKEEDWRFS